MVKTTSIKHLLPTPPPISGHLGVEVDDGGQGVGKGLATPGLGDPDAVPSLGTAAGTDGQGTLILALTLTLT